MSLHRLTQSLRHLFSRASRRKQTTARRQTSARLELLALESRETPATLTTGTVSGLAFLDSNNNGRRDGAEPALAGASFTLVGNTDFGRAVRATVATGAVGGFRFLNVATGSYQVIAEPVAGFTPLGANHPVVVFQGRVNGGKTVGVPVRYAGLPASNVSINQFLNTSTISAFQTQPPGAGRTRVNPRENNRPIVLSPIKNLNVSKNAVDTVIDLNKPFGDSDLNTRVRFVTSSGTFVVELFDQNAPRTVANFLGYVRNNGYDSTIFHRLVNQFVLQGGGYQFNSSGTSGRLDDLRNGTSVPKVQNEFGVSNVRGTIAMAKLGEGSGSPDPVNSATDEFFFNLGDNSANLDNQNGGFTVFGRLLGAGDQAVVDRLIADAQVQQGRFNSPFDSIPLKNYTGTQGFVENNPSNPTNFTTDARRENFTLIRDIIVSRPKPTNEALTYKVIGNTNQTLVRSLLNKNTLTLDYVPNATGTSRITVRATDRFGAFVDTSFNVTVANNAPVASVALSPATVGTNGTLTATATGNDINGGDLTFTYVWKKNGTVIKTTSGTTEKTDTLDLSVAGNGDKNDVITVEVTANDGLLNSAVASASKTVQDTAAAISNLAFTPDAPGTDDLLTVTTIATDIDGDAITFTYRWLVDDVVVPNATTDKLDLSQAGHGNVGQTVKVEVTPTSGGINGTMVSFSKVIL